MLKRIKNDRYEILFDTQSGFEMMQGINGHSDPFILDYPTLIDIGIMGHCENKCVFCYQGDKVQPNMQLEHFKRIIDESKDYTMQVALGGRGDPNKHENFKHIIAYCRDKLVVPNYTTSGINLTDEEVGLTKDYCGAVAVSMHSKNYTWKAINMFTDKGCLTNIHFVLSEQTLFEALALVRGENIYSNFIDLNKINAIIFLLFKPQGRGKNLLNWRLSNEKLRLFFCEMLENEDKRNFMVGMDSCLVNKLKKLNFTLTPEQEMSVDSCEGARMSCYISSDMNLMPCSFCNHDEEGQSILDSSIQEVWKTGNKFENFRNKLISDSHTCPYEL